jgi:hypothetical protein
MRARIAMVLLWILAVVVVGTVLVEAMITRID